MWREGERGFDFEPKSQVGRVRLSRFPGFRFLPRKARTTRARGRFPWFKQRGWPRSIEEANMIETSEQLISDATRRRRTCFTELRLWQSKDISEMLTC